MKKEDNSRKMIAYQSVLNGIINGEYEAKQIINEKELIEKLGFSKSPIREALVTLCNEGVLRNLPRYGYEVIQLTKDDIIEILNFRLILEGGFLKKNYQKITEKQLSHLYYLDELCKEPVKDPWLHWEHNTNFHVVLLSYLSENEYACMQLKKSMDVLKRVYGQFFSGKWRDNVPKRKYHQAILNSIKEKDIESAINYLEKELTDF